MVHASPLSRHRLAGGGAPRQSPTVPLTTIGPDKIGPSYFCSFDMGLPVSVHFVWQHIPDLPEILINPATGAVYQIPDGFVEEHVDLGLNLISESKYLVRQVARTGEYKVFRKLFHFPLQFLGQQLFKIFTVSSSRHSGWRAIVPIEEHIKFSIFSNVVEWNYVLPMC
jgi:hypothetical protein